MQQKRQFITPTAPHENGWAEAMVKSCTRAIKKAIGDNKLTPFELYNSLIIAKENTKKITTAAVVLYAIKFHVNLHKL